MKLNKEWVVPGKGDGPMSPATMQKAVRLNLDMVAPPHFCGVYRDSTTRGVFALWITPTQFRNVMVATALELRLGWPPVRFFRGWVGTE